MRNPRQVGVRTIIYLSSGISIMTALVYDGELDDAVVRSGAFDAIIPFSQLLGLGKA